MAPDAGETARIVILVGLILQVILVLLSLLSGFGLAFVFGSGASSGPFFVAAGVVLVWVILVYRFSYVPTANEEYDSAGLPTLIFGLLSMVAFLLVPIVTLALFSLLPGVFLLIGWVELHRASERLRHLPKPLLGPPKVPEQVVAAPGSHPRPQYASPTNATLPVPPGSKYCATCGQPTVVEARTCRNCGANFR